MYNVYLISSEIEGDVCYKIGFTKRDPKVRIKEMKTGNASELRLVDSFKSKWGTQIESKLHRIFNHKKISGEWFRLERDELVKFREICESTHNNLELMAKENSWFINSQLFKKFN
jgi:hypothetical protein